MVPTGAGGLVDILMLDTNPFVRRYQKTAWYNNAGKSPALHCMGFCTVAYSDKLGTWTASQQYCFGFAKIRSSIVPLKTQRARHPMYS
jgi:hypothetical protein